MVNAEEGILCLCSGGDFSETLQNVPAFVFSCVMDVYWIARSWTVEEEMIFSIGFAP